MAHSKRSSKPQRKNSKKRLDAFLISYQRDLERIHESDKNVDAYRRINATLVVAGPQEDIDKFETLAASPRLVGIGLAPAGLRLPESPYWRTRSPFSLVSLLTHLESSRRKRFRHRLPSQKSGELFSRLETLEGRVRLEFRFTTDRGGAVLEQLLCEVARVRPALSFVLVVVARNCTESRASLITASRLERFRLPRRRHEALFRRAFRFWGDSRSMALDEAAGAILSECAAQWDADLASVAGAPGEN
jgi:hypothetical protein